MKKKTLDKIDEYIYSFLKKNCENMPIRLVKLFAYNYTDARIRKLYLRKLGVVMGTNSFSNLGMRIVSNDFKDKLFIGNNVSIAPNVVFICESSANNGKEINRIEYVKDHLTKNDKIVICDEVWIGANVTILQGVKVGECAVIGAGSVVLSDVPPYSVVAGNPARIIRHLKYE
ncbi:MAG: galactoside O-acetyltransferase [Bacilli bacterium]